MNDYISTSDQIATASANLGNNIEHVLSTFISLLDVMLHMVYEVVVYCVTNPFLVIVIAVCFMYWCRKKYKHNKK